MSLRGSMGMVKVKVEYMCLFRAMTGKWEEVVELKDPTLGGLAEELGKIYGEDFGRKLTDPGGTPMETKILVRKASHNWLAREPHHLNGWDTGLEDGDEVVFIRWFTRRIFQ
jgi:molybdopterin converting factor small subunit